MIKKQIIRTDLDIEAFLDNELSEEDARIMHDYLENTPEAKALYEVLLRQKKLLKILFK